MEIYYINTAGNKILLSEWPIAVTDITQLYGRSWSISATDNIARNRSALKNVYRTMKEFTLDISIYADSIPEYEQIMNNFENVTDYDNRQGKPGKLYVNDWYLECFIRDTNPSDFEELFDTVDVALTVYSTYPHWVKEINYEFRPSSETYTPPECPPRTSGGTYPEEIAYPYIRTDYMYDYAHPSDYKVIYAERDYKYDYLGVFGYRTIENDMLESANFVMYIHGYVMNPTVIIGGNYYIVETTVYEGETLIIDSRDNTVKKVDAYGNEYNVYNSRGKEYSIFTPIPSGQMLLNWPATYMLELTIFDERSEPEWNL